MGEFDMMGFEANYLGPINAVAVETLTDEGSYQISYLEGEWYKIVKG